MNNDKRDNFTSTVKNKLAKRVLYVCSNPNCRKITIGPDSENGVNNIGVAAHICAADLEVLDMIKICRKKKEKV